MKAKAFKKLDFIDIIDEKSKTVYRCSACTNEEYETCWNWTSNDCKEFLKTQGGTKMLTFEEGEY